VAVARTVVPAVAAVATRTDTPEAVTPVALATAFTKQVDTPGCDHEYSATAAASVPIACA
jgi:hypothetical protein